MMVFTYVGYFAAGLAVQVLVAKILKLCWIVLWRPYALTKSFEKQGIKGPSYSILHGTLPEMKTLLKAANGVILDTNCHDIAQRVQPHYNRWSAEYGEVFLFWRGVQPAIRIADPKLAKQILSDKSGAYAQPQFDHRLLSFAGNGVGQLNGPDWVRHRSILTPAFTKDKLKLMTKRMAACTIDMIDDWKNRARIADHQHITIEMSEEFKKLTCDVITHTAFGSNYVEGGEVFKAQDELIHHCVATMADLYIPGSRFLPTPSNRQMWKMENNVNNSLRRLIQGRLESAQARGNLDGCYGDDVLGLLVEASKTTNKSLKLTMDEIIDECKQFFFSGHETTAKLLTWTVFLLSLHQEWQERLREEVLTECGMGIPDADMVSKLKLLNMVLLETLRLYCPVLETLRETSRATKLGDFLIPKGVFITIQLVQLHRSKEYWGEDANDFNPLRFKNGVSQAAKHPNAFLGFGMGPRTCLGQNFAMLEVKLVLSLLLQRFSFVLSPEYKHAPANYLTMEAQYGVPTIVKPLLSK
ncbi:cytochrome P450 709B2 [Populus alba]|uniref:Cytochrome P450 family protein n=1 Tax=Populus alba TaxID=43335 RepID=A0A4U5PUZ2_POPAL|nr:cytochrome P450 709B2-like [Populus alba]TKS01298.1 cytochrome P450 family protein [Populus alba]